MKMVIWQSYAVSIDCIILPESFQLNVQTFYLREPCQISSGLKYTKFSNSLLSAKVISSIAQTLPNP